MFQVTPEMKALLVKAGDQRNENVAMAATRQIAEALQTPLREGVLKGDILGDIFETQNFAPGQVIEYPYDFITPGTEKEYVAYVIPNHGYLPQRHVEGNYVTVPTFDVGAAMDTNLKYIRDARWDIVQRVYDVVESMFVTKSNIDGWRVLTGAAYDRNIVSFDADAASGQFTKRLVSLMQVRMRRETLGNTASVGRTGKMTDLYVSLEAMEDIRNWGVDQIDEVTRRDIFLREDGSLSKIFGVILHDLLELGVNQEIQNYFVNTLGGSLAGDTELVLGLDLKNRDSFMRPVRQEVELFEDPVLHRQRRWGLYGWLEHGFSCLFNQRVLAGSF